MPTKYAQLHKFLNKQNYGTFTCSGCKLCIACIATLETEESYSSACQRSCISARVNLHENLTPLSTWSRSQVCCTPWISARSSVGFHCTPSLGACSRGSLPLRGCLAGRPEDGVFGACSRFFGSCVALVDWGQQYEIY